MDTEDDAESGADVEKLSNREKEASVIAGRIHELIRHQMVKDKKTEQMRPAEFRDIVILTRSMKGYADVYMEVLKKRESRCTPVPVKVILRPERSEYC